MARPRLTEDLAKLVKDWCAVEQIAQLLRDAKDTSEEVRVTAPKKEILIEKNLRDAVESAAVPLDKVYNLIREAEENGDQHIFYFHYRRSGQAASLEEVGSWLWGKNWAEKVDLPRADLVENDFIFADLHPWNKTLKPHDWVLKIYGHEYVNRYTDIIKEIGKNRFTHEFFREERRIVIVVRWNNEGTLEIRIPQTESRKRLKQWLQKAWLMISPACPPTEFTPWNLTKARGRMIAEQKKNQKIYRLVPASRTSVTMWGHLNATILRVISSPRTGVSIPLCKRPGFVFGMGCRGRVSLPLPIDVNVARCHCATLSRAGIRSGHRIVKWFKASRQWWIGMVHFFAA